MMTDVKAVSKVEAIAAEIRERVCLAPPGERVVLHEGELAAEFSLSRTPIRQVLQKLAYEHLVHTQSGVGTIAAPLHADHRGRDLRVFAALLQASANCVSGETPHNFRSEMIGLKSVVASDPILEVSHYFSLQERFLSLLSPLIADDILRAACLAAHWRVIRWRISDFARSPEKTTERFQSLLEDVVNSLAETNATSLVLTAIADAEIRSDQ